MDIGTGIALAGIWMFPAACALSKTITGLGMFLSIFTAFIATGVVLLLT